MDRSTTRAPEHRATVRVARAATVHVLLRAPAGECREPAPAPAARRTVYGLPVFRQPPNGGHAGDQPQARSAADAYSRHRSALSQTESEPSGVGPRDLSVPAARGPHHSAQSGLEYRYYLELVPYAGFLRTKKSTRQINSLRRQMTRSQALLEESAATMKTHK